MDKINVLIIDDEQDALQAMAMGLGTLAELQINTSASRNEAINRLKSQGFDIVITDLKLKDGSGLEIIDFIQENHPQIAVVVVTAHGSVDTAVRAIRGGALDYLQKPVKMAELKRLINRITENIALRRENEKLRQQLDSHEGLPVMIGVSSVFKDVIRLVKQVAPVQSTVLITGESGTGKEIIADAIEYFSERHGKPFIKINCGAIPENLLEAELFGYEKGAFTGAAQQKKGKIERAHEGTLFLDEIGELPKPMQVKLLRVLQNGEFERLGATKTLRADIRLLVATNSDLESMVQQGTFREDLFYRLNVITVHIPPLRDRIEDIPLLVQHFIERFNRINNKKIDHIDPAVLSRMKRYSWKGNVRELENMIERAVVLAQHPVLKLTLFPALLSEESHKCEDPGWGTDLSLAEIEKNAIIRALRYHNHDKNKTAMALQIGLATLYRKIKEYGIDDT